MFRLLRFLVTGDWHLHQWEDIKEATVENIDCGERFSRYYCKCKICGKHKRFDS